MCVFSSRGGEKRFASGLEMRLHEGVDGGVAWTEAADASPGIVCLIGELQSFGQAGASKPETRGVRMSGAGVA